MCGFLPRPCYSFQHLQNCCHETKSRDWVGTHMQSVACSKCEPASQRERERDSQEHHQLQVQCPSFDLHAANADQSCLLVAFCKIYNLPARKVKFGMKGWTRMRDVHARRRMFFARFARSSCQNIQMWELYRSQACLQYDESNSMPR